MVDQSRIVTISSRLYNLLLLAYPARFRRAYGREMAQVFHDDMRGTFQEGGAAGLIAVWLLVLPDLFETAFAEHIWEVFHMPMENLERWTGLAAALGGALFTFAVLSTSTLITEYTILAILGIAMFLLWAIALAGLYRRLSTVSLRGNRLTFAIVLVSLLVSVIGILILPVTEFGETLINIGFFGIALGIAGMGIIALRFRALGIWSFAPLLLAFAWLGSIAFSMEGNLGNTPTSFAVTVLVGISWLLLGIGLWTNTDEEAGPALSA